MQKPKWEVMLAVKVVSSKILFQMKLSTGGKKREEKSENQYTYLLFILSHSASLDAEENKSFNSSVDKFPNSPVFKLHQ